MSTSPFSSLDNNLNHQDIISKMDPSQKDKIQQAIDLLQSLTGGQVSIVSPSQELQIPEFDQELQLARSKAQSLEKPIQELTSIYNKASHLMKKIMAYSKKCKKYTAQKEQMLKEAFMKLAKEIEELETHYKDFSDHAKSVKELLNAPFWVETTPEFMIKGAVEAADFNALKFMKKKNMAHNEWWKHISNSGKKLQKFVTKNYGTGLIFSFNGSDLWDQLVSDTMTAPPQIQKVKPTVTQQKKVIAKTIQKPSSTKLVGMNWNICDYKDQQISLSDPELQMKHGIYVQNCRGCGLGIKSKFKSIQLNNCENTVVSINSCISGIEVMNSKKISIIIKQFTPSISVDKCDNVKITLNQDSINCDIVSSKATDLNVFHCDKQGNQSKKHFIFDQLITKWNPNKKMFETKIYDKFL